MVSIHPSREEAGLLAPASVLRRVAVVGGGPAGMEAARRLTLRGHHVVLLEAASRLGGAARIAAAAHPPNGDFVEQQQARLAELSVEIRLNTHVSARTIRELAPDVVVVATGAVRRAVGLEGKDLPHVHDGPSLRAMLRGHAEEACAGAPLVRGLGERVVIIGAEPVGLELAELLQARGRRVSVLGGPEPSDGGPPPEDARRSAMLAELPQKGVAIHEGARAVRIGERAVGFTGRTGEAGEIAADSVIIATGARPNTCLFDELVAEGHAAHMAGDCAGLGHIAGAVRSAAAVAALI